jgi:hypothetical protein
MVQFVPSLQPQSSTHHNVQQAKEISIDLNDSLYIIQPTDSGIVDVKFKGQAFARNSICFGGILFNVSSFSFSLHIFPTVCSRVPDFNIAVFPAT